MNRRHRRLPGLFWLLCLALAAPHGGAHAGHDAVRMVICGGAKTVTLWIEREDAHAAHSVDCCLIHAAVQPGAGAVLPPPPPPPAHGAQQDAWPAPMRGLTPAARDPPAVS